MQGHLSEGNDSMILSVTLQSAWILIESDLSYPSRCRRVKTTAPNLEILSYLIIRLFTKIIDFINLNIIVSFNKSNKSILLSKLYVK